MGIGPGGFSGMELFAPVGLFTPGSSVYWSTSGIYVSSSYSYRMSTSGISSSSSGVATPRIYSWSSVVTPGSFYLSGVDTTGISIWFSYPSTPARPLVSSSLLLLGVLPYWIELPRRSKNQEHDSGRQHRHAHACSQ